MTKLQQLKSLLQSHGLWAKKSLGQNFLVDEKALEAILEAAELRPEDQVVEVGPGTGLLTEMLIEKAARVTAIELDGDMVGVLKDRFKKAENLEIVQGDVLKFPISNFQFPSYKLVANIPYYITSPLIKHFLHATCPPSLMVLLVQKEVAEKICGKGGKTLLSVQIEVFGQPELVALVRSNCFHPAPKVDSAILRIRPYAQPLVPAERQPAFFRLVQFGYSQKRKKLSNTLAAGLHLKSSEAAERMEKAGIDPNLRAEHLGVGEWLRLCEAFADAEFLGF